MRTMNKCVHKGSVRTKPRVNSMYTILYSTKVIYFGRSVFIFCKKSQWEKFVNSSEALLNTEANINHWDSKLLSNADYRYKLLIIYHIFATLYCSKISEIRCKSSQKERLLLISLLVVRYIRPLKTIIKLFWLYSA